MKFYHITDSSLVETILHEGLKGSKSPRNNDREFEKNMIFAVDQADDNLFKNVAICQIWCIQDIEACAIIEIDREGITGSLYEDVDGERTKSAHVMIEQDIIEPRHLSLFKILSINYPFNRIQEIMQKLAHEQNATKEEWELYEKWNPAVSPIQKVFREMERQRYRID